MKLLELFKKDNIGEAPWTYRHLINLEESEYPKYLKKIFYYRTEEDLPLKREKGKFIINKNKLKTFNQKLQWIKLYGVTPLMRDCTDKVNVRNYISNQVGEQYLKPVLQICKSFDEIEWEKLPDKFVLKCNHGCKWHCIVKDKQKLLLNKQALEVAKSKMTGWLEQEFWPWEGFELNYHGIEPKILIEPFMPANRYIEIYCFNGIPKIYSDIQLKDERKICTYNEDFSYSDLVLKKDDEKFMCKFNADDILKQAGKFSKQLAEDFKFVRVDWIVFEDKLYFEELTFTPYSGFSDFGKAWNEKLGDYIEI